MVKNESSPCTVAEKRFSLFPLRHNFWNQNQVSCIQLNVLFYDLTSWWTRTTDRGLFHCHPPTAAVACWSGSQGPASRKCSGKSLIPLWWKPYYWCSHMYGIRVASTCRRGNWEHTSRSYLALRPGGYSKRRKKVRISVTAVGMPTHTYTSFIFMQSVDTSMGTPFIQRNRMKISPFWIHQF